MLHKTQIEVLKSILSYWTGELKFFGNKALTPIDAMNIAEISLSTKGVSGNYPALTVIIQNKENGEIARNTFIFEDYCVRTNPNNNPYPNNVPRMYIWRNERGYDWYIIHPETTKPICDVIFEYIEMYS